MLHTRPRTRTGTVATSPPPCPPPPRSPGATPDSQSGTSCSFAEAPLTGRRTHRVTQSLCYAGFTSCWPWVASGRCQVVQGAFRPAQGPAQCSGQTHVPAGGVGGCTARAGVGHLGLTHTGTQRGRLWTTGGRQRCVGSKNGQTAAATTSTAPVRQQLGSANAETAPARAPATAFDKTQRPDAACEGKNG